MRNGFKKPGFYKMDEMDRHIAFRAQRNAYFFLVAGLFAWSMYESYSVYAHQAELNLTPTFLLIGASLIQSFSQLLMKRKAVEDDEEYAPKPLWRIILLCMVVAVIAALYTVTLVLRVRP